MLHVYLSSENAFQCLFVLIYHSAEFAEASPDPKNTFTDMLKAEYVFVIPIL